MPCNYARLVDLVFLFLLVVGVNKHRLNSYLGMELEVAVFWGGFPTKRVKQLWLRCSPAVCDEGEKMTGPNYQVVSIHPTKISFC